MSTTLEFLRACSLEGNTIVLPSPNHYELEPNEYTKFKKLITGVGGSYNTGKSSFSFAFNPRELLNRLATGENYQHALQFFPTPDKVVQMVRELINPGAANSRWLEPSAGRGALIGAIKSLHEGFPITIDACEIDEVNREILTNMGVNLVGSDFLQLHTRPSTKYDAIVLNPPFSKGQYMTHITRAYDHLKPGGNMVFIAPENWLSPSTKAEEEFSELITPHAYEITSLKGGAFRESGTAIATVLVGMHRPLYDYCYNYSEIQRDAPVWAASLESEAQVEIADYFAVIDRRGPADIKLNDVRLAAANLGLPSRTEFCLPILASLTQDLPQEILLPHAHQPAFRQPEYDFGFQPARG